MITINHINYYDKDDFLSIMPYWCYNQVKDILTIRSVKIKVNGNIKYFYEQEDYLRAKEYVKKKEEKRMALERKKTKNGIA